MFGVYVLTYPSTILKIKYLHTLFISLHRVRVRACNELGCGLFSSPLIIRTKPLPPEAPELLCQQYGNNHLKLSWLPATTHSTATSNELQIKYLLQMRETRSGRFVYNVFEIITNHGNFNWINLFANICKLHVYCKRFKFETSFYLTSTSIAKFAQFLTLTPSYCIIMDSYLRQYIVIMTSLCSR